MRSLISALAVTLVFALSSAAAKDKTPPPPEPIGGFSFEDQIEVTLANIDVFVQDKKGNPITGLGPDDFVVRQDGDVKIITNFAVSTEEVYRQVEVEPAPESVSEAIAEQVAEFTLERDPVWIMIYVDNENIRPFNRNRILNRVREFASDVLASDSETQAMVVSYQKSFKVDQSFTTDAMEINAALRNQRRRTGARVQRDSERRRVVDAIRDGTQQSASATGNGRNADNVQREAYTKVRTFADEEANDLHFTLSSIREAVTTMAGLPGKKAVLYVSDGLPMIPGIDLFYEYSSAYNDTSILNLIGRYNKSRMFESVAAAANGQNVQLYTIDGTGLQVHGGISAEHRYAMDTTAGSFGQSNYQASLRYLAEETGGLAILNTNDPLKGLNRIKADLLTFYSIGYPINASGADKVHRIKVDLPNHPQYALRYRRRMIEKSLETRVQDQVATGMVFDLTHNPLFIDLQTDHAAPAPDDRWLQPVNITFPLRKITLLVEGDDMVGRIVLYVGARDTEGQQSDMQRQEHELRIPASEWEEAQLQRWTIELNLLMREGPHRISVGVLDLISRDAGFKTIQVNAGH